MGSRIARILCAVLVLGVAPAPAQDAPPAQPEAKQQEKQKKKDKSGPQEELNADVFSDRVANAALGTIRDGIEGHSSQLALKAFDGDRMSGYPAFADALEAMFNRYDGFRVHYRILQTSTQGSRGIVLAAFEIEQLPASGAPQRKGDQLRFELERGKKGWRIVDVSPRGFFS